VFCLKQRGLYLLLATGGNREYTFYPFDTWTLEFHLSCCNECIKYISGFYIIILLKCSKWFCLFKFGMDYRWCVTFFHWWDVPEGVEATVFLKGHLCTVFSSLDEDQNPNPLRRRNIQLGNREPQTGSWCPVRRQGTPWIYLFFDDRPLLKLLVPSQVYYFLLQIDTQTRYNIVLVTQNQFKYLINCFSNTDVYRITNLFTLESWYDVVGSSSAHWIRIDFRDTVKGIRLLFS